MEGISRRRILAGIGSVAITSSAGCTAKTVKNPPKDQFKNPSISIGEEWKKLDEIRSARRFLHTGISTSGAIYSNQRLKSSLNIIPGELDMPVAACFAAQVNLYQRGWGGDLGYGALDPERVLNSASIQIKRKLKNQFGLQEVTTAKSNHEITENVEVQREFRGQVYFSREKSVNLNDGTSKKVTLTGNLPVRIIVGVWRISDSEDMLLVGGAYPESNLVILSGSVTSDSGKGIDAEVVVDLDFSSREIWRSIRKVLSDVQPP